jgi:hypothetical protein
MLFLKGNNMEQYTLDKTSFCLCVLMVNFYRNLSDPSPEVNYEANFLQW